MLELIVNGSLFGNESGIGFEEGYEDMLVVMDFRLYQGVLRYVFSLIGKVKIILKFKEFVV